MIDVSLDEVVSNIENMKVLQDVKLPVKISYRIMRLVNKLQPILNVYNEKRNAFIKEFGEIQEDKTIIIKDPEKLLLFTEKMKELLSTKEKIDFDPLKIEDLGDISIEPKLLPIWIFE